jgi:hypothetical protein
VAANSCAWINEATASGFLGGDAVGEVSVTAAAKRTVCTFTQRSAGVMRTLQVTVELSADPHERLGAIARICGTDVAQLTAIGKEAFVCAINNRKIVQGERVVGRVRDQVFTIASHHSQERPDAVPGRAQIPDVHSSRVGRWQSVLIEPQISLLTTYWGKLAEDTCAFPRESRRQVARERSPHGVPCRGSLA